MKDGNDRERNLIEMEGEESMRGGGSKVRSPEGRVRGEIGGRVGGS